ncbi:hypothetical protein ASE30_11770 [Achromobacter sp. Root83]|uniref:hypothetical protein n=1 Tax=Achromobacter sp. Root83 TaxID=1736602 RepID=UPI00070CB3EB|nr:hypothetical protein [Achromobacter sp. Root83]KRC73457.1 hypothetical protein ASE30_11770 [Achromobacter sp. Root83]
MSHADTLTAHPHPDNGSRMAKLLATGAFSVIFPAYIAYQILVQKAVIRPYLGGYFTAGIALALPLLLLAAYAGARPRVRADLVEWLFLLFMTLFGLSVAQGLFLQVSPDIVRPNALAWVTFVVLYLFGALFPWGNMAATCWAQLIFLGLLPLILLNSTGGQLIGGGYIAPEIGMELNYQAVAMAFIVIALAAIPPARVLVRYGAYAFAILSLYMIGARSEFVAFVIMCAVIEFCMAKRKVLLVALGIAGLIALLWLAHTMFGTLPGSRILGLSDINDDPSVIARAALTTNAWLSISNAPIMGNYGSYLPGNYAHNILSAWVDMGYAGLVTLVLLLVFAGTSLILAYRHMIRTPVFLVTAALLAANLVLLLVAKHYTYQLLPIALGAYRSLRLQNARMQEAAQVS